MDPLLMLDNKLVKVEVVSVVAMEETQNYHCIICNGEFITIAERNEHLETHFIHRNCKSCCRPVVVIGGLEFELHHPTHCKESESYEEVDILDGDYSMDAESGEMFDNNSDDEKEIVIFEKETWTHGSPEKNEKYEINIEKTNKENGDLISKTDDKEHNLTQKVQKRPTRKCTNVQYSNEQNGEIGTETEEEEEEKETKKRILVRNVKREPAKRGRKPRKIVKRSDIYPDDDVDEKDGEDDVVRAMDFAMRKRRINYAKLPKTIPCGVSTCDIKFSSDRALKCHMTQAHGIKERYICPICSREFKISGNLKQHVETHTDYKRFICNYCGKGFHLPFNLKEHINSHTGARPWKCDVCDKTFGRRSLREAHRRVHTGEKPYKCESDECDRAYAYKVDLKRHQRSVHGIIDKTFPCPICGKIFYENKYLTKHINVHKGPNR